MIGMALFWVLVILGIVVLVRRVGGSSASSASSGPPPSKTALDILNELYARGEIDKQEFEEKSATSASSTLANIKPFPVGMHPREAAEARELVQ